MPRGQRDPLGRGAELLTVQLKKVGNDANNRIFVKFDTTVLERIEKELGKKFMAQVGILGLEHGA